ncbi:hypothetical protein E8D34_13305 [Nocardioides sp. GY 10113]|uniref:DUF5979 domain-containing protein n=1 Tax=Nocardioides sp. GY 10113 TaxID=2569761 RepID=UPI0010A8FA9C|nr:DUF5979 domain-containing protein [Nocardioides sp. GY 10113]TIC85049.1 hypothetical protein E8D34_13305 [Nocardioides sp. GY 10113]
MTRGARRDPTRWSGLRRSGLVALALLLAALGLPVVAASPGLALPDSLDIEKSVDNATPQPGANFTYTIQVNCYEEDCLDTQITDALPAALDGFPIVNVSFTPGSVPNTVTWEPGGTTDPPATVGPDTSLTVDLEQVTDNPVGTGLEAGSNFTVQITLRVPDDFPPGLSPDIVNEATVTASNADEKSDDATINIDSEVIVDVTTDKTWGPTPQDFGVGSPSTIGLDVRNTSNVSVDEIQLQEPSAAPDGATELDPSNPFTITDFTGFGDVTLPAGCDSVQVDAYVQSPDGTWNWANGPPTPTPTDLTLPPGVTNADVGGIRVTCTGDIPPGESVSVDLGLEQRAGDRNDDSDLSTETHTVDNVATGSVTNEDATETDDGTASYTVDPLIPTVEAGKNITPQRITAGQSSTATITGTNGDTPVTSLHLADVDFFTPPDVAFGGWTGPLTWPADADEATIVYQPGGETVVVGPGETPPDPTGDITGFEITWTGDIQPNETGGGSFDIDTTENATGGAAEVTLTNNLDVDVEAGNGLTDDANATDDLEIVNPSVEVTLDKTVRPSTPVYPGETVISSLETNATATGDGAFVDEIVVTDAWDGACDGFWNAFNISAVAPTQVPADTVLTIEVQDASGSWVAIQAYGPETAATVFQMSQAEVTAALSAAGLSADDVQGVRFTFTNQSADGFPSNTTVTPNIEFTARGDLRDPTCPAPPEDTPITYSNSATAEIEGETDGGNELTDGDGSTDTGEVIIPPGGGPGAVDVEKTWDRDVASQSNQEAGSRLDWSVGEGLDPVVLTDMASDPATGDIADSVFDAFNLTSVDAIAASDDPYANGWWLKYDTVTSVELYDGTQWVTVPAPGGTWMTADRGFKGYALTAAEQESTIGVRITLEETAEDTAAREAAQQVGDAFDPFAPDPGSGVGAGSTWRSFNLGWELRDTRRSDGSFVTGDLIYNTADEGLVDNTFRVTGTESGGGTVTDTDDDTILIIDQPPAVEVEKSVDPTEDVYTPPAGTDPADYPYVDWSVVAHNASVAKASYVRVTDPATCTDTTLAGCQSEGTPEGALADPFVTDGSVDYLTDPSIPNPFERFNATSITIGASDTSQVDLDATTVWLLRYDEATGTYSTTQHTATEVNAMGPAELEDVVGISVTYQGTDPEADGGSITQDTDLTIDVESQLRPTYRSDGTDLILEAGETYDQTNRAFAQSYDPVTAPGQVSGDVDDATTQLTGGIVNTTATKSVDPATITEPQHDAGNDTIRVTLGANQGTDPRSTLSPAQVVIEDQAGSPEFWDAFDFADNVSVVMPNGADQVQIDLYDGTQWVNGTPGPAPGTLPAVADGDVQGIRVTFSREDGQPFSATVPAPNWNGSISFDVDLRDEYRSGGGVEFPSTVVNTQTSQSFRPDGKDSDPDDAGATVELTPGTHELAVNKLTNGGDRLASAGDSVPFDLTIENTGTGYLTLTELTDVLPPELVYTGDPAPEFTADPGGMLSSDVTVTASGSTVVFTWPDDGNVMAPGETFTIRVWLELQPGLGEGETATNTMVAGTEEQLDRCTNTEDGGPITDDWADDPTTCGTTDDIGTVVGPNLFVAKGVIGSLPGAIRPTDLASPCNANLTVGGQAYYRSPCAANSQVGGTDDWVLHSVNSGTVSIDQMTIFDQLPIPGDLTLLGSARESDYRPQLVADSLVVDAPAGTAQTIEVTTSPNVCVGTWSDLVSQPVCEQSGEIWVAADGGTDWTQVTGLRIALDFTGTTAGSLQAGQAVDVTFSTLNVLQTAPGGAWPEGASRVVPAADEFAWNQFGVKYLNSGQTRELEYRKTTPGKVGVHLRTGSVRVDKEITGPASMYAPDEFLVDLTCVVGDPDGGELDLGDAEVLELNAGNGFSARVDGIPVSEQGTQCTFEEQGDVGDFSETSRSGTPTTVDVTEPTDDTIPVEDQDVPGAQIVTITNDYQFTGLSVTKRVDTDATDVDFGPFTFTLSCVTATGDDVVLDDDGTTEVTFQIGPEETWIAPEDRIPVGATCTLTETDADAANGLMFTGDNLVDNGDGSATVTPGETPAEVEVTNAYDAGSFTLAKEIDGAGAALYGDGTFVFHVVCTYQDQTPFGGDVELLAGDSITLGPYPTGTECVVEETGTAGADAVALDPDDGVVTIPEADDPDALTQVSMTATNTFDVTQLEVEKTVIGDLTVAGAKGPFTVTLECTRLADGEQVAYDIPGGADRILRTANDYRASYDLLAAVSRCTLTESDANGAAETSIVATVDGETVRGDGDSVTFDLSGSEEGAIEASIEVTNKFVPPEVGGTNEENPPGGGGSILPGTGAGFGRGLLGLGLLLLVAGGVAVYGGRRRA